MKILYISAVYPPYPGGIGNVAYEEASRLAKMGHEVHVLTIAEKGSKTNVEELEGVVVHHLKPQIRWTRAGLPLQAYRLLREESFEVIHMNTPFFGLQEMMVVMMWFGWRPKMVTRYHMDIVGAGFIKWVSKISRLFFLPTLIRRSQKVLTASMDYAKSSHLKGVWLEVENKLLEIPFGVDLERFHPNPDKRPGDIAKLLFLGGLDSNHYFKGLSVLIDTLEMIKGRDDWELNIIGDGDLRAGYEEQAAQAGLEGRVTFVGRAMGKDEAESYYRNADVFVFPSVDRSEAFGLVSTEAQASGTPVIASDLDGVRGTVFDNKTGLLVPPKDKNALREAVEWMIDNPDTRYKMGRAARVWAEHKFDWDARVGELVEVYESL